MPYQHLAERIQRTLDRIWRQLHSPVFVHRPDATTATSRGKYSLLSKVPDCSSGCCIIYFFSVGVTRPSE